MWPTGYSVESQGMRRFFLVEEREEEEHQEEEDNEEGHDPLGSRCDIVGHKRPSL